MRMETASVTVLMTEKMPGIPTGRTRIGLSTRRNQTFKTKTKTKPHPIISKTGLAIESKTPGKGKIGGKIVQISETVCVMERAQIAKDPEKETVEAREKRGPAPFLSF